MAMYLLAIGGIDSNRSFGPPINEAKYARFINIITKSLVRKKN